MPRGQVYRTLLRTVTDEYGGWRDVDWREKTEIPCVNTDPLTLRPPRMSLEVTWD